MNNLSELYQSDYSAWAQRQAQLLRAGHYAELDIEHLLQELSDMSKSDRRELESRLLILMAYLLKWQFQYPALAERWREFDGRSWRATIVEQRKRLAVLLRESPGLQSILTEAINSTYADALDLASKETRLPPETFPEQCPYQATQLFDDEYYPGSHAQV